MRGRLRHGLFAAFALLSTACLWGMGRVLRPERPGWGAIFRVHLIVLLFPLLLAVFARIPGVQVRHRRFYDTADFKRVANDLVYIAEPTVLVVTSHGLEAGITVEPLDDAQPVVLGRGPVDGGEGDALGGLEHPGLQRWREANPWIARGGA